MLHIGILASTNGTDMQAIIDAIAAGSLECTISVVISNKKDAYALARAAENNIEAVFISAKDKEREDFDKEVDAELKKHNVDVIVCIGYMRILSPWFVQQWEHKIMNIHPSLLPDFAGGMDMDVHAEVLKAGVKQTGATLHFVDETVDGGPIILQKAVAIADDETKDTLKAKVQRVEGEIIVQALDLYSKEKITVQDNKVTIRD